jgi:raffinose/stachyose/melibiose transport system permease protein
MSISTQSERTEQQTMHNMSQKRQNRSLSEFFPVFFGLLWLVIAFYPLLYMFMTSLRSQAGFYDENPWLPPLHATLENYLAVWQAGFSTYLINSLIITIVSVALIVCVSLFAAYAIARLKSRFAQFVFNLFLVGLAIPLQATIIPIFVLISEMGLYDTLLALILPSVAFGIPMTVLILVTYIRDIPKELYESMQIDGATHVGILRRLVLPLSRPALITVIIYQSIGVWNGFLFPLVLTQSPNMRVLPLALWSFQGEYGANIPAIMAAVFLSAVPIILLYLFGRRYLLSGMIAGFSK